MQIRHTILAVILLALCSFASGDIVRSSKTRTDFVKDKACPANALHKLPCPGFIMDHKQPLDCGGPDTPANVQWLTEKAWRDKFKWERTSPACKHPTKGKPPVPLTY